MVKPVLKVAGGQLSEDDLDTDFKIGHSDTAYSEEDKSLLSSIQRRVSSIAQGMKTAKVIEEAGDDRNDPFSRALDAGFDESKHPRIPKGTPDAGQFTSEGDD